ncbi:MAG TPA: preprotein translocase subunit SecG [Balneolaceae bacterium]|nr:preprotein translocase subunit SecG [Balneolaceae bacterium]
MSTSVIFLALIIIVCFLLVVVIMVQNPKGGGLSSSFGGGGGGQQMGGVKKTNDFLDKSTWTLATALLVLVLLYNVTIVNSKQATKSRLIDDNATPETSMPAPAMQNNKAQQPAKAVDNKTTTTPNTTIPKKETGAE